MNALTQNTKITASDINTLISELNGKLNLSGGVMTGRINLKDTNLALGEVTEHTWHNSPIQFYDKNNKRVGYVQTAFKADGHGIIRIQASNGNDSEGYLEIQSSGSSIHKGNFHNFGVMEARTSAAGFVVGPENKQSCIIWNNGDYTMISPSKTDNRYSEGFRSIQIRNSDGQITGIKTVSIDSSGNDGLPAIRYLSSDNISGGEMWTFSKDNGYWKGGILLRSTRTDNTYGGDLSIKSDFTTHTNTEIISTGVDHNPAHFRAIRGDYGFMIRNDGTHTWFLLTAAGDQYGSWQNTYSHPMYIENSTNEVFMPKGAYLGQGKIWIA